MGYTEGSDNLRKTSSAFTSVGKKAIPAVVFIKAEYNHEETVSKSPEEYENPFDFFSEELYRHFFKGPGYGFKQRAPQQITSGSGFIVSEDGYILTNNHIVEDATKITVIMNNGEELIAKKIGTDPRTDLAVLKIEKKNLPFISFGDSDELQIGEWVIAIGNPFSLQSSLTVGVVSAKGRQDLKIIDLEDFIQTDASINPGNSGGPLLNLDGEVVGVNSAILTRSGGYMGIGFAIPSKMAKHVMDQIIASGSVKRGYIGIYPQPIDKEIAEAFDLEKSEGVLVAEISPDSPAEKAGLKQGDIILEYNNKKIINAGSFRTAIALMSPGEKIDLKILRDSKYQNISVVLAASPETTAKAKESTHIGIEVSQLNDLSPELLQKWGYKNKEGLVITHVQPGSLADRAGLAPGMLILQINQKRVSTLEDFHDSLKNIEEKRHILLLIRYKNVTRFITIRLK